MTVGQQHASTAVRIAGARLAETTFLLFTADAAPSVPGTNAVQAMSVGNVLQVTEPVGMCTPDNWLPF